MIGHDRTKSPTSGAQPSEIAEYASLLGGIDEAALRAKLDFPLMDKLYLPVEYWQEEGEETFTEYIVPLFERRKALYVEAERMGQCVLVWHA